MGQLARGGGVDETRREALVTFGKYAAYTVPAMSALLLSKRAMAAVSPVRGNYGFDQEKQGSPQDPLPPGTGE